MMPSFDRNERVHEASLHDTKKPPGEEWLLKKESGNP